MTNLTQITTYHEWGGSKIKETYFIDEQGKKQGDRKYYGGNNKLGLKISYKDDKKHGDCTLYYEFNSEFCSKAYEFYHFVSVNYPLEWCLLGKEIAEDIKNKLTTNQ